MTDISPIDDLKWSRETQQKRGGKTQMALLEATESLILESGTDGFSMQDVAKRAGSSIGSLYHHFKDKDALLNALFARMIVELEQTYTAALAPERWEGAGVLDIIRGFSHATFHPRAETQNPHLAIKLSVNSDPKLHNRYAEAQAYFYTGLYNLLRERRDEIGHPDPDTAICVILDLLGPMWRAWRNPEQQATLLCRDKPDEMENELVTLAAAYLRVRNN
ncbi:MAG: TetR/AcrR family transcriptional regulator [Pseudomonadota bacterium]